MSLILARPFEVTNYVASVTMIANFNLMQGSFRRNEEVLLLWYISAKRI